MRSRMDKYYTDEKILQRTSKNDSLYEELYRGKEPTSNVTVLDNINEIDITKIKNLVDSRENYKKVRQYESLMKVDNIEKEKEKIEYEIIDDSNYDINQIIEKKKNYKVENDELKVRKISEIDYDALKNIDRDDEIDFTTRSIELKELIDATMKQDAKSSTDLFANLKETSDGSNALAEVQSETKETTFYTNNEIFDKKDFNDEIFEDEKESNAGLITITVVFLIIAIGVFIWFKFFQ